MIVGFIKMQPHGLAVMKLEQKKLEAAFVKKRKFSLFRHFNCGVLVL
jgi:hypothetical protein